LIILFIKQKKRCLAGGMTGADIGIGWIDSVGKVYLQV